MQNILVQSIKTKEVVDITKLVNQQIEREKMHEGICVLFVKHTTAALTTADLDPGTDLDMLDAFEAIVPKLHYRHPHDPSHVPDHIMTSMIGTSLTIPVKEGVLELGKWQRVVIVELDGPREREIVLWLSQLL